MPKPRHASARGYAGGRVARLKRRSLHRVSGTGFCHPRPIHLPARSSVRGYPRTVLRSQRVLVFDDRPGLGPGIRALLAGEEWIREIVEVATLDDMRRATATQRVDLVAMNMTACSPAHLRAVQEVTRTRHTVAVALPGADDVQVAVAAFRAGVRGYLLDTDTPDVVRAAVRIVAAGGLVLGPGISTQVLRALSRPTPLTTPSQPRSVHCGLSIVGGATRWSCRTP
jgi:DNA-binding NarL/FixJ family response regulator